MADTVVALVGDHAGFELKNSLKNLLAEYRVPTVDLGPGSADPVDCPHMVARLGCRPRGRPSRARPDGVRQRHRHRGQSLPLAARCDVLGRHHGASCARTQRCQCASAGARLIGLEVARLFADVSGHALCRRRHARRVANMSSAP
jgi:hypothetical protein